MKTTVVPAQVTTVEDRIMGNLGLSQILLFILPVFIGAGLYALLPPNMGGSLYKYLIITVVSLVSFILAIRIRGKIVLLWILTIARYNLRPKYYIFNKNTQAYRKDYDAITIEPDNESEAFTRETTMQMPQLDFHQTARVLARVDHPEAKLRFETSKKGALRVRLTEIQD